MKRVINMDLKQPRTQGLRRLTRKNYPGYEVGFEEERFEQTVSQNF